jgi:type II secretory pathway component GspD/PulD (secretin)
MKTFFYTLIGLLLYSGMPAHSAAISANPAVSQGKLITLDYVNADVTDVLRAIAAQSGVNLALSPSVHGQVTIHLREKSVDDALKFTANMAGLGARKLDDTYVIAPGSEMKKTLERLAKPHLVPVSHMTPQAASDLVQSAFPDLTARVQGNSIDLLGATDDLTQAEKLIQQNDHISLEDEHSIESVPLKNIPTAQAVTAIVKMIPGINADAAGASIVLSGSRSQIDAAKQGLLMLDVPGEPENDVRIYTIHYAKPEQLALIIKQTVPDVKIVAGPQSNAPQTPILNTISASSGTLNTAGSGSSSQNSGGSSNGNSSSNGIQPAPVSDMTDGHGGTIINPKALTLILQGQPDALDQAFKILAMVDVPPKMMKIEAKVMEVNPEYDSNIGVNWQWNPITFLERPLASAGGIPSIPPSTGSPIMNSINFGSFGRSQAQLTTTLNLMIQKNEAKLLANPQIAVMDDQDASVFIGDTLRYQVQTSGISGPTISVYEVPVGIILLVHPKYNNDGYITLHVHPQVSTAQMINSLPQTHTRETDTIVRVKDGDTLVIGGLINDQDIRQMSKVPFLGDLPVIGQLFRNYTRSHTRNEVMIFLTIHMTN